MFIPPLKPETDTPKGSHARRKYAQGSQLTDILAACSAPKHNTNRGRLLSRLRTVKTALLSPSNWPLTRMKCLHPRTFDLVHVGDGRLACFLKTGLPMDPKQAGFYNYDGEDNRYFHLYRKDAALLHVSDWMAESLAPIFKPLLAHVFDKAFSDAQINQLLKYLNKPDIIHNAHNRFSLVLNFMHDQPIGKRCPFTLNPDQINLVSSLFIALSKSCDYLIKSFTTENVLRRSANSCLLRFNNMPLDQALAKLPTDLSSFFIKCTLHYYKKYSKYHLSSSSEETRAGFMRTISENLHNLNQYKHIKFDDIWLKCSEKILQRVSKVTPIRRIDENYLSQKNLSVPIVHCNPQGTDLYLLEHHRIWGAQLVGLPIQVDFLNISTLS